MQYNKEDMQALLAKNDMAVVRGIEAIYARQTSDERAAQTTSHSNGRGFNGTDAYILSSFAKQIASWRQEKVETGSNRYPFPLSPKQLVLARRKMHKYGAQLALVANEKAAAVEAECQAELAAERAAIETAEAEYLCMA
jgi:hypothetical protein